MRPDSSLNERKPNFATSETAGTPCARSSASLTLHAVADSNGRDSFAYKGHDVAPILRVSPGDTLKIEYVNDLPAKAKGSCAISPRMDMTNLHFHGLHVSP